MITTVYKKNDQIIVASVDGAGEFVNLRKGELTVWCKKGVKGVPGVSPRPRPGQADAADLYQRLRALHQRGEAVAGVFQEAVREPPLRWAIDFVPE